MGFSHRFSKMIRNKDVKFIAQALDYATKHRLSHGYTMVAFLVKSKNIVSIGINDYRKTTPRTPQIKNYVIPSHAEIKCVSRWLVKNRPITSDMTLYVVGMTQGRPGRPVISSEPCESCQKFIETVGIPRVVYFENNSEMIIKEMLL